MTQNIQRLFFKKGSLRWRLKASRVCVHLFYRASQKIKEEVGTGGNNGIMGSHDIKRPVDCSFATGLFFAIISYLQIVFRDTLLEVKLGRSLDGKQKEIFNQHPAGTKKMITTWKEYLDEFELNT